MKIAVFTDAFSPQVNGVVTHLNGSLPLLAKKHSIQVFAPQISKKYPKELIHKNIVITTYQGIPVLVYQDVLFTSPYYQSVYEKIVEFQPDVIHVHTPFTMGANGVIAAKRLNIPLVQTFHTYVNEPEYLRHLQLHKIGMDKSALVQKGVWAFLELFYGPADVIICPSEMTARDLAQRFPDKKVVTISNGVPLKDRVLKRSRPFKGDYFVYVGRASVEKNINVLIDAFVASGLAEKSVSLVIVGKGPYLNELKKYARQVEAAQSIIFAGELPHKKVMTSGLLHGALAFVSASTSETQGITFLEAMAAGLPLIVAESKATTGLIDHNGIVCGAYDARAFSKAMIRLYANAALRKKYGALSRINAKKHNINTTVALLEKAYSNAIFLHAHPGS